VFIRDDNMSEDFLRLVSQANPATRQYQPAHNGYPPSSTTGPYLDSPQPMDPFFDDDDDNMPDSTFGRPAPMQSQESGLPLTSAAVPPAGSGPSKQGYGDGVPQGWNFDDDDFQRSDQIPFPGSEQYPTQPSSSSTRKRKWEWKWPWRKEKVLTGERIITLNNSIGNADFCSNSISTSKYNLVSFVPKFLTGTFLLHAYGHFLHFACIQNNSQNMPTCFSSSPLASSKFRMCLPQINGLQLLR
jgi:phospholipid-transporting ATPase